jgi:hypothetical protein
LTNFTRGEYLAGSDQSAISGQDVSGCGVGYAL